jgi:hypothetical protein
MSQLPGVVTVSGTADPFACEVKSAPIHILATTTDPSVSPEAGLAERPRACPHPLFEGGKTFQACPRHAVVSSSVLARQ